MEDADERGMTIDIPFTAAQVVRVYTEKKHPHFYGGGLWFELPAGNAHYGKGFSGNREAAAQCKPP